MDACALNLNIGGAVPLLRAARNNMTVGLAPLYCFVAGWAIVGSKSVDPYALLFCRWMGDVEKHSQGSSPWIRKESGFRVSICSAVKAGDEKKNNHCNSSSSGKDDPSSIPEEDDGLDENFAHHGKQAMMKSQSAGKDNPSIPEVEYDLDENFPHSKKPQ